MSSEVSIHDRSSVMIAAERRRRIYDLVLQRGSVTVSDLANELSVVENTIRRDLDALHQDGKVLRSHGGATLAEGSVPTLPYSVTRDANIPEKTWIGEAALEFIPEHGFVFINAGSTTKQLVNRLTQSADLHIATNSPELALCMAANSSLDVQLLGGKIIPESLETDCSLDMNVLDNLYWDVSFLGISALDLDHGITSINLNIAALERKVMEHSKLVIALCDSSKFGRFAHARTGPIDMIDILITDDKVIPTMADELRERGVELVIAGPSGENRRN